MSDSLFDQLVAENPEFAALVEQFRANKVNGQRSPIRQQLTDLREPSNVKDRLHRPQFFFADPDEAGKRPYVYREYPKVMYHVSGGETIVLNKEAEGKLSREWKDRPVFQRVKNSLEQLQDELAMLSPEDREFVMAAQRAARLTGVQRRLAELSDAELALVTAEDQKAAPKKVG